MNEENTPSDFDGLSVRALDFIRRSGFTHSVQLLDAIESGEINWKLRNCGAVTKAEILAWLYPDKAATPFFVPVLLGWAESVTLWALLGACSQDAGKPELAKIRDRIRKGELSFTYKENSQIFVFPTPKHIAKKLR